MNEQPQQHRPPGMPAPAPHHPAQPAATPHHTPHPPPMRPGTVPMPTARVVPPQGHAPTDKELEPLSLVEDIAEVSPTSTVAPAPKKILAFGSDTHHRKTTWKRQLQKTGTGATRLKSFHGKYSEQGLEYLDNAINEWLDNNADVEVKFVTSTVMTFEGKIREPALVLNVWY